jgi:hypothetical protein
MRLSSRLSRHPSSSVEYTRALRTGIAALALATLAACGSKGDDTALKTDTALGRDLAMAATDTAVKPKLQDEPAPAPTPAPAPAVPAPKPAKAPAKPAPKPSKPAEPAMTPTQTPVPTPVPAAPKTGTIAAGTLLRFEANSKVCSNGTQVGDKFTAALSQAVSGSNGAEIPAGATGTFEVSEAKTAKNNGDTTFLKVRLLSVTYGGESYPVESTVQTAATTKVRSATRGDDAKKVGAGAVIGAIAGQVIGKNTKGTVIGAAAGAAAGGVVAAQTADFNTCLNSGAAISVKLNESATVRIGN